LANLLEVGHLGKFTGRTQENMGGAKNKKKFADPTETHKFIGPKLCNGEFL
jgi:hypothetical protein